MNYYKVYDFIDFTKLNLKNQISEMKPQAFNLFENYITIRVN